MLNIPQFVPSDVCLKCEGCCRFDLTQSDWRPKIGESESEFFSKESFDDQSMVKAVDREALCHCIYFDSNKNACKIYDGRPFECQLYPFLLMEEDDKAWIGLHLACPHIQDHLGSEVLKNFIQELQTYTQSLEFITFLSQNPSVFRDYSDYKDEIEKLFCLV